MKATTIFRLSFRVLYGVLVLTLWGFTPRRNPLRSLRRNATGQRKLARGAGARRNGMLRVRRVRELQI